MKRLGILQALTMGSVAPVVTSRLLLPLERTTAVLHAWWYLMRDVLQHRVEGWCAGTMGRRYQQHHYQQQHSNRLYCASVVDFLQHWRLPVTL